MVNNRLNSETGPTPAATRKKVPFQPLRFACAAACSQETGWLMDEALRGLVPSAAEPRAYDMNAAEADAKRVMKLKILGIVIGIIIVIPILAWKWGLF